MLSFAAFPVADLLLAVLPSLHAHARMALSTRFDYGGAQGRVPPAGPVVARISWQLPGAPRECMFPSQNVLSHQAVACFSGGCWNSAVCSRTLRSRTGL